MAGAVDPTYPLYPIASILAAVMLLLVLLTSFIRQSWNLGVAFLCFWLFVENLTGGINHIIWSDNADVKLYVYCDIGQYIISCARLKVPYLSAAASSLASAGSHHRRQTNGDLDHNPPTVYTRQFKISHAS